MANGNGEGADSSPEADQDSPTDKSFVGKIVSGLISNTPLSKWFGPSKPTVRRRDELEDDEEPFAMHQPPYKRAKLPSERERGTYLPSATNNVAPSARVYSNFPEPVPGPSGIHNNRQMFSGGYSNSSVTVTKSMLETPVDSRDRDFLNGAIESDSEESTSGYCSQPQRGPKKAPSDERSLETSIDTSRRAHNRSLFGSTHGSNRSLFSDRSLSPHRANASLSSRRPAFNASTFGTHDFLDRTTVTRRILSSPFYNGRTMYGGASACRSSRSSSESNQSRASVQMKPINERPSETRAALSKTARRILSTLEQYSTPISDAKKIPVGEKRKGLLSRYVTGSPYSRKLPSEKADTNELQVPTIPQLIQLKQKERLQNSTVSVRQIATTSKSQLNEEYKMRPDQDGRSSKRSGKMKSGLGTSRQKPIDLEPPPRVNLPKVSLPITNLPKFDFVVAPPSETSAPIEKAKPVIPAKAEARTNLAAFKFSRPVVISSEVKKVTAINDFKFSRPLDATKEANLNFKMPESRAVKAKNNGEKTNVVSRSVSDVQKLQKQTSPSKGSDVSFTSAPSGDEPKKPGFSFDLDCTVSPDTWKCTTCLIRNKNEVSKCAACEMPRENSKKHGFDSFWEKQKHMPPTWECKSCLVRNESCSYKCQACETPRESARTPFPTSPIKKSLSETFKTPSNTWECPTCMIRNKDGDLKCVACETGKPGAPSTGSSEKPAVATTYSFGIKPSAQPSTSSGFGFGAKPTTSAEQKTVNQFTFGIVGVTKAPSTAFSFAKSNSVTSTTNSFTFGDNRAKSGDKSSPKGKSLGFGDTFRKKDDEWECTSCLVRNKTTVTSCSCCGTQKPGSSVVPQVSVEQKPVNQFSFGIVKTNEFTFGIPTVAPPVKKPEEVETKTSEVTSSTTTAAPPTFSFGVVAPLAAPAVTTVTTVTTVQPQTGFTFAAKTVESAVTKTTNPLLKPNEKLPPKVEPIASPSTVKFGVPVGNKMADKPEVGSVFGAPPAPVVTVAKEMPKATFEFKPSTMTTVNGEVERKNDLFSSAVKTSAPSFKFEPVSSTTANSSPAPMFKFGSGGSSEATALPSFGATGNNNNNSSATVKRSFGESLQNNKDFNSVANSSNGLGAKVAAFGAPPSAAESAPFGFGDAVKPVGEFGFGSARSGNAPTFKFGEVATAAPSFGFSPAPPQGGGFNFGGGASVNKTESFAPAANVFGAATVAPGAVKNGSFNFGTPANSNQKAIFTFGAGQTSGNQDGGFRAEAAPPAATGGFNFGAPQPAAPAPGGFNFSGAQPSFNFSDGTAGHPQRRIRKALRRTHR